MEPSYIAGRNVKWYNHFGKQIRVPQNVKHNVLYNPPLSLLGIYTRKMKHTSTVKLVHECPQKHYS